MAEHATPHKTDGEVDRLAPYDGPHDGRFGRSFDEEVDVRQVINAAIGLVLTCVVVMVVTWFMIGALLPEAEVTQSPIPEANERPQPPLPRLQTEPTGDLQALRREMAEQLHGYGWVDEGSQVVYIPVEKAMDLYLERRQVAGATSGATPAGENPSVGSEDTAGDATSESAPSGEAEQP